jgi:hypothetical protein
MKRYAVLAAFVILVLLAAAFVKEMRRVPRLPAPAAWSEISARPLPAPGPLPASSTPGERQ